MSALTTNYSLYEPSVGETGWGALVNANWDTIDNLLYNRVILQSSTPGTAQTGHSNISGTDKSGAVSTGAITATGLATITKTTEQLRLRYDASNYAPFTVDSGGDLTIAPTGSDIHITGGLDTSTSLQAGSFIQAASYIAAVGNVTSTAGFISAFTSVSAGTYVVAGSYISATTYLQSGTSLAVGTSATIGTTLGVTGATTLAGLSAAASTLTSLSVTNNTTVGGTLGITGATTAAAITASGLLTLNNQLYVTLTTTPQMVVRYDTSNALSLSVSSVGTATITTVTGTTGGNLVFAPVGNIIFNPTGNSVLPNTAYAVTLGSPTARLLAVYAAELQVQNLVTTDTQITTNGRLIVGPSTELIADVSSGATTIDVKLNNLNSGDRIRLETGGKFEAMAVTSAASTITGGYRYNVTRDLDGTGANAWIAGDAVQNTGTTGNGYIDLFSLQSSQTLNVDYIFPFVYSSGGTPFETGTYSANQSALTTPTLLAGHAINDSIYFGMANTTWANLYIHVGTAAVFTGGGLVYEYWNGSAWTSLLSLTLVGNAGGNFAATGLNGFEWTAASQTGWAAKTINGVSAYWIRIRWSVAPTTWTTSPLSSARRIYRAKYQYGPTAAFYKRNSSTWDDVSEAAVSGNLMGFYGYATDTYGFAAGVYANSQSFITADSVNGFRILKRASSTDTVLFQADTSGNLTLTGNINLSTSGVIRSGQTAYNTGTGYWLEYFSGTPRMSLGVASGAGFRWDGSTFTMQGALTATSGSFTGGLTIGTGGSLSSGQTAYNTGTGYWLEYFSGTPRMSLGSSTQGFTWDGTTFTVNGAVGLIGVGTIGSSGGFFQGSSGTFASPTTGWKLYQSSSNGVQEWWNAGIKALTLSTTGINFDVGGVASLTWRNSGGTLNSNISATDDGTIKTLKLVVSGTTLDGEAYLSAQGQNTSTGIMGVYGKTAGSYGFITSTTGTFLGLVIGGSASGTPTAPTSGYLLDMGTASILAGGVNTANGDGYYGKSTGGTKTLLMRMAGDDYAYIGNFKASVGTYLVAGGSTWLSIFDTGVFQFANNSTTPGTPTGGPYVWAASGALKAKGTSGTATTMAAAEPHCPRCGADFVWEWENPKYGGRLALCAPCLVAALGKAGIGPEQYAIATPTA